MIKLTRYEGNIKDTQGRPIQGTWSDLVDIIREKSISQPHTKGTGGYLTASCNWGGIRAARNAKTIQLFVLDCDSGNTWDDLQAWLDLRDIRYCIYETASSSPTFPKWRCIIPLDREYDISTGADRAQWSSDYLHIMRHLARHGHCTFDDCMKNPVQAIYFGHRQTDADAPRQVLTGGNSDWDISTLRVQARRVSISAPTDVTIPATEATTAAEKWLAGHPCPSAGQGLRHGWTIKAAVALVCVGTFIHKTPP